MLGQLVRLCFKFMLLLLLVMRLLQCRQSLCHLLLLVWFAAAPLLLFLLGLPLLLLAVHRTASPCSCSRCGCRCQRCCLLQRAPACGAPASPQLPSRAAPGWCLVDGDI